MKPLLLILDDWEGKIAASACWTRLKEYVDIKFLQEPINEVSELDMLNATYLMAVRERTPLNELLFSKLPRLKLILQTGGHAYHIDTIAAKKRNITIALGRKVKAPQVSVPELTLAMALNLVRLIPEAQIAMRNGKWPLLTGRTLGG